MSDGKIAAQELRGKRIAWQFFPDKNRGRVIELI